MKLDTERAIAVFEGQLSDRGCGKTTLAIANICNHLILGNNQIYCRINYGRDIRYLLPMFVELITDNYREDGLFIVSISKPKMQIVTSLGDITFFVRSASRDHDRDFEEHEQFLRGREGLIIDLIDYRSN